MEYVNVINVKKRVSPLTYLGIILLVVALAFASMLAVLNLMKPAESYRAAEAKYFSSMSSAFTVEQNLSAAMEYELNLGLNTGAPIFGGYYDSLNNTIIKGFVGVDGSKIDYALDYFNGNKKVLSAAFWLNDNIISIASPELSDILLTFEIPEEYLSGNYADFDYDALGVTLTKITDKYFELVGEPEIVGENVTVEGNGTSVDCVMYRVNIDKEFATELAKTAIDAILENENLVELCGGDEFVNALNEAGEELNNTDDSGDYLRMDVYASDNIICKREISVITDSGVVAMVDITNLEDSGKGYFALTAESEGKEISLINEYTKNGNKASGTLTLSTSTVIYGLISGELCTVTYKDAVYDERYGYSGEFKLSVPSAGLNIKGTTNIDDKYNFNFDIDIMGQQLCNLGGYFKYYDNYTDSGMPDKTQFEEHHISIDSSNPVIDDEVLERLEEDVMEFFGAGLYEKFADENGNLDVLGTLITSMFISSIGDFSTVNDFAGLY